MDEDLIAQMMADLMARFPVERSTPVRRGNAGQDLNQSVIYSILTGLANLPGFQEPVPVEPQGVAEADALFELLGLTDSPEDPLELRVMKRRRMFRPDAREAILRTASGFRNEPPIKDVRDFREHPDALRAEAKFLERIGTIAASREVPSAARLQADEERRDIRATQMADRFLPSEGPPLARLLAGVPMSTRLLARENARRRGGSMEDADRLASTMNPLGEIFSHRERERELGIMALLEELGLLDPNIERRE